MSPTNPSLLKAMVHPKTHSLVWPPSVRQSRWEASRDHHLGNHSFSSVWEEWHVCNDTAMTAHSPLLPKQSMHISMGWLWSKKKKGEGLEKPLDAQLQQLEKDWVRQHKNSSSEVTAPKACVAFKDKNSWVKLVTFIRSSERTSSWYLENKDWCKQGKRY